MTELEIKAAVRLRDGYRCTLCGMTAAEHVALYGRGLDVHRVVPGSVYNQEGCITVCRPCHGRLPKRPRGTVLEMVNARLPDDVADALEAFIGDQPVPPTTSAVTLIALRQFLQRAGYLKPGRASPDEP